MLATGLLALYQLTTEAAWLTAATELLDIALAHFADHDNPGRWFDSADDGERLLLRPADPYDGATPSGASAIAEALLTAAHLTGGGQADRYRQAATDALQAHSPLLARAPRSAGHWLAVAEAAVRGPLQIAVACGGPGSAAAGRCPTDRARRRDRRRRRGGLVRAARRPRPRRRRRRGLRLPRSGLRPAGHQRRGIGICTRPVMMRAMRPGAVACLPCRVQNTSPRPSTATSA